MRFTRSNRCILFALLFSLPALSPSWADNSARRTEYIESLSALPAKKFQRILVEELKAYIVLYPEAANVDQMHFRLATLYQNDGESELSFFTNMQIISYYPGSEMKQAAIENVKSILLTRKAFSKIADRVAPFLTMTVIDSSRESLYHTFLRDMVSLQFEPLRHLLIDSAGEFLEEYPASESADEVLFWRAELLAEGNKPEKALAGYIKLTHLFPTSLYVTSSKLKMAELFSEQLKDHEKAILTLEEFLVEFPRDPQAAQAQMQLARIQEEHKKKYLEALNSYEALAHEYPNSVEAVPALFDAARLYEKKFNDYDQAIRVYTAVVRDFSEDLKAPHAMAEAARIYEKKLRDYANAADVYFKVFDYYPDSALAPQSLYAAAELSEKRLKNTEQALGYFRQLAQKYPNHRLAEKANKRIAKMSRDSVSK